MTSRRYAPKRPGAIIPMPDRGNRPIPATGAALDLTKPYYARLKADGDIVDVKPAASSTRRRNITKDS